ncbi:MAG: hydrolase [Moraxellaceae bacterium]|nr:MAG: hydrolase [Moraxellaceae bacterium]
MSSKQQLVDIFHPNDVTTIDTQSECEPGDVGLTETQVEAIWRAVVKSYRSRLHPGISICIRRNGRIILNRAIGHSHGNAPDDLPSAKKIRATPDSLFNLYSASKAVAAMMIHHLDEKGLIHLDDPLCRYLPEFSEGPKRFITVRHVLTHRAGIPQIPRSAMDLENLHKPGEIRRIMGEAPMQWAAGRGMGYHAISGGFIMGALVEEITGMDIRQYLDTHFLTPLGFKNFNFGVPESLVPEVAPNAYTGYPFPPAAEKLITNILGMSYKDAIELSNHPLFLTGIVPAANIIGTAEETSRFYEMLLNGGELYGTRVLEPETIRRARLEQSHATFDRMFGLPMRYSLGFMLGRKRLSLYQGDTPKAFGHLGLINVVGYADPQRGISVGIMNNGKHGLSTKVYSFWNILRMIAYKIPKLR